MNKKYKCWVIGAIMLQLVVLVGAGIYNLRAERYDVCLSDEQQIPTKEHPLTLDRGSYLVTIYYETELDAVYCAAHAVQQYGESTFDSVQMLKEDTEKTFEVRLQSKAEQFYIDIDLNAQDIRRFHVSEVRVCETGQAGGVACFLLGILFLIVDTVGYLWMSGRWRKTSVQKRNVVVAILTMGIISSLPLAVNYMIRGDDMLFHLMRIEGLAQGLREGQFPVKMQPLWLNNYGYPVSVFYGDLLLYIPAILRLIGFSLQGTYKIYVLLINLTTAVLSYFCGKKLSNDRTIGLVSSFVYTFSIYRLMNLYYRSALGELTALAFYPFVFMGLWMLFSESKEEKRRGCLYLIIGYTVILESHLLSFEMIIVFSAIFCLLNLKVFLQNILRLLMTAMVTILLNLHFLIPMLDYMNWHALKVENAEIYNMQNSSVFPAQLLQMFAVEQKSATISNGMQNARLFGVGLAIGLGVLLFIWGFICYGDRIRKLQGETACRRQLGVAIMMLLATAMSCYFFPWNAIREIPVIGNWLAPYQFGWRFLGMATLLGMFITSFAFANFKEIVDKALYYVVIGIICGVTMIGAQYEMDTFMSLGQVSYYTSAGGIDTREAVVNGEYLFEETYAPTLVNGEPQAEEEGLIISEFYRENGVMYMACQNTTDHAILVRMPVLAYMGYEAKDCNTGYGINMTNDYQHILELILAPGYSGKIEVKFVQPSRWRKMQMLSLVTLVGIVSYFVMGKRIFSFRRNQDVI